MAFSTSRWRWCLSLTVFVAFSSIFGIAQSDPDPNSPTPVLLTVENTTHALAIPASQLKRTDLRKIEVTPIKPRSLVTMFVTNVPDALEDGAGAFRVYAEDTNGHVYRFPVTNISEAAGQPGVWALTVRLIDEVGYYEPPKPNADLLISLSWRGLISNSVKLGHGATGGKFKMEPKIAPAPLSQLATLNSYKGEDPSSSLATVGYKYDKDRARFLEQAAFGPSAMDDLYVRRLGLRAWLNIQFDAAYPSPNNPYPDLPLKSTDSNDVTAGCGMFTSPSPEYSACIRDFYTMYPLQNWFFKEALYGNAQLRHRVSWALAQIWVIAAPSTQQSTWMTTYHQVLSKNAFGNYRQLMYDMTLNPGMGNYLDMIRSTKNSPNENYPREILQLFTLGTYLLNPDGTRQLDGQGNPIPTYDQTIVNNFTKVFTGWRDCRQAAPTAACPNVTTGAPDYKDPMELATGNHDLTAKTLFTYPGSTTTNIAACASPCSDAASRTTYAYNSLNQALDNIYNHPNLAPFVCKLLIQHMVTSDPTPAYVGRVSAVFNANRTNPTQMREVIKAIMLDPEARGDVKTDPRYGKLREPVQLLTNVLRNFDVSSADLASQSDGVLSPSITALGQNPFNSPSVFNFFSPTYIVPSTTIIGPEFGIFNTGASIGRANLFATFAFNGLTVQLPDRPNGTKLNLAEAQSIAASDTSANRLLDYLNIKMMHNTMSPEMRSAILPAITAINANNSLQRAQTAVYLIASSSQFQVQR